MNVVLPAPFTPITRMTVGAAAADDERGVGVPGAQRRRRCPCRRRVEELVLRLHEAALRQPLDLGHQPQGDGDAEVRLEQQLLELLERALARRRRAPGR